MRDTTLVQSLHALHSAGLSLPPISGGDGTEGTGTPTPTPTSTPPPAPDLGKLVEAAVAKHGDQTAALKAFAADLYAAKDDLKAMRAKLPPDGSVMLAGDDVKHYEAYKGLGTPAEIRKAKEERDTLAAENSTFKRDTELRGVAEKAGVKFAVLKALAGPGLTFEPKTVKVQGKDVEIMHVKDGEAAPVPIDDYAKKHWSEFLPALKPGAIAETRVNPTPNRQEFNPLREMLGRPGEPVPATPTTAKGRHIAAANAAI